MGSRGVPCQVCPATTGGGKPLLLPVAAKQSIGCPSKYTLSEDGAQQGFRAQHIRGCAAPPREDLPVEALEPGPRARMCRRSWSSSLPGRAKVRCVYRPRSTTRVPSRWTRKAATIRYRFAFDCRIAPKGPLLVRRGQSREDEHAGHSEGRDDGDDGPADPDAGEDRPRSDREPDGGTRARPRGSPVPRPRRIRGGG